MRVSLRRNFVACSPPRSGFVQDAFCELANNFRQLFSGPHSTCRRANAAAQFCSDIVMNVMFGFLDERRAAPCVIVGAHLHQRRNSMMKRFKILATAAL